MFINRKMFKRTKEEETSEFVNKKHKYLNDSFSSHISHVSSVKINNRFFQQRKMLFG
jgi:hypothetical protein